MPIIIKLVQYRHRARQINGTEQKVQEKIEIQGNLGYDKVTIPNQRRKTIQYKTARQTGQSSEKKKK